MGDPRYPIGKFTYGESAGPKQLDGWITGMFAWHGNHHPAHITTLKDQKNWWDAR